MVAAPVLPGLSTSLNVCIFKGFFLPPSSSLSTWPSFVAISVSAFRIV